MLFKADKAWTVFKKVFMGHLQRHRNVSRYLWGGGLFKVYLTLKRKKLTSAIQMYKIMFPVKKGMNSINIFAYRITPKFSGTCVNK